MSNVVDFPRHKHCLGIRTVPSQRIDGWLEVQRWTDGTWRAQAIFLDEPSAKDFLGDLIVKQFAAERTREEILDDLPF